MAVPFVDLRRQYLAIKHEIDSAISEIIAETAFIGGEAVSSFEDSFARYVQAANCVGVANGTDAIEIALEALLGPEQGEVIVPANSFIASSEAVTRAGHRVVFADIDTETYTLDPADARRRITPHTRAIVAVHLYGHPADMQGLRQICDESGLVLIEDAAQAHGAEYRGARVGSLGDAATFSFYPGKNLGAYGDAGAITTNDDALARRMRMLANHGRVDKYDHLMEGRNSRLDGLQAAVLNVKLRHLDAWTEKRRLLAERYRQALRSIPGLKPPVEREWARHTYHLFVVQCSARDELQRFLAERQISTGIHYPVALPRLGAYETHRQHEEAFRAADLSDRILSLPMGDSISPEEVDLVCEEVLAFFA